MCSKQLAFIAILAVAATALPIAVPKTDGTAPINIDPAIQPEKIAIQSGEKTPIIAEKIPSTYADTGTVVGTKEEPKPYKTPAVDPIKPVDGQVVPEVDTKVQGEPAVVGDVSGTFRELPETEPKEEKVDPLPVPDSDKAPTLAVGDIDTKDPIEGPNLHKVEGVVDREGAHGAVVQDKVEGAKPYEAKVETAVVEEGVAVDDETTRDEKVPDGVEQYGSVLEFSKYDTNGDGVIDFDEWNIIHGGHEKITGQFHAADINGDKQLEQTEFHGATWYHDGGDVARDALMLAIAEQAASTGGGETNHAMTAAAMPSTEFRYIVDDAESSAQGVPVVPAEPVDVVVIPEKPAAPSVNVPVDVGNVKTVEDSPAAAVPTLDVVEPQPVAAVPTTDVVEPQPVAAVPTSDVVKPQPVAAVPTSDVVKPQPVAVVPTTNFVQPQPVAAVPSSDVVEPRPVAAVPTTDVVQPHPVAPTKEKAEVPQVPEVVKDVQPAEKVEHPKFPAAAVVAEKTPTEPAPLT
ncbi:uncharacterized protein LOC144097052 [Amblyomma americanum]